MTTLGAIVRKIVAEELDHQGIKEVVDAASAMLKAIKNFKEDATHEMLNVLEGTLSDAESELNAMITDPQSWTERRLAKSVTLKPVDSE